MIKKFLLPAFLLTLVMVFTACGEVDPVAALNDITPPVVSITSPADGATLTNDFVITADASDGESAIFSVEFYVNGVLKDLVYATNVTTNTLKFSSSMIQLSALSDGPATLKVIAKNGKQLTTELTVSVIIDKGSQPVDTTPPVLSITAPASGEVKSNDFTVIASASDPESGVSVVTFYLDDVYFSSTANPMQAGGSDYASAMLMMDDLTEGSHTIKVVAQNGKSLATTNTVTFTVVKPVIRDTLSLTLIGGNEQDLSSTITPLDVLEPNFAWSIGGISGVLTYRLTVFGSMQTNVFYWVENIPAATLTAKYGVAGGGEILLPAVDLVAGNDYIVNVTATDLADSNGSADVNHIGFARARFSVSGTRMITRSVSSKNKPISIEEYYRRLKALRESR